MKNIWSALLFNFLHFFCISRLYIKLYSQDYASLADEKKEIFFIQKLDLNNYKNYEEGY